MGKLGRRSIVLYIIALLFGLVSHIFLVIFLTIASIYTLYHLYLDLMLLKVKKAEHLRLKGLKSEISKIKGQV